MLDTDFDLVFPNVNGVENFVSLRPFAKSLREVSTCLWLRTADARGYGTIFSYAVANDLLCSSRPLDAFTLFDYGMLKVRT